MTRPPLTTSPPPNCTLPAKAARLIPARSRDVILISRSLSRARITRRNNPEFFFRSAAAFYRLVNYRVPFPRARRETIAERRARSWLSLSVTAFATLAWALYDACAYGGLHTCVWCVAVWEVVDLALGKCGWKIAEFFNQLLELYWRI